MSSKSDALEQGLLDLIFLNANLANIGDATGLRGSTAAGSLFAALFTADPGEAGTAITNEVAYTGYSRVGVARSAAGWARSGSVVTPVNNIDFPEYTTVAAGSTCTHWGIVSSTSGAGTLLYRAPLTPNIPLTQGTIPRVKNTSSITED